MQTQEIIPAFVEVDNFTAAKARADANTKARLEDIKNNPDKYRDDPNYVSNASAQRELYLTATDFDGWDQEFKDCTFEFKRIQLTTIIAAIVAKAGYKKHISQIVAANQQFGGKLRDLVNREVLSQQNQDDLVEAFRFIESIKVGTENLKIVDVGKGVRSTAGEPNRTTLTISQLVRMFPTAQFYYAEKLSGLSTPDGFPRRLNFIGFAWFVPRAIFEVYRVEIMVCVQYQCTTLFRKSVAKKADPWEIPYNMTAKAHAVCDNSVLKALDDSMADLVECCKRLNVSDDMRNKVTAYCKKKDEDPVNGIPLRPQVAK